MKKLLTQTVGILFFLIVLLLSPRFIKHLVYGYGTEMLTIYVKDSSGNITEIGGESCCDTGGWLPYGSDGSEFCVGSCSGGGQPVDTGGGGSENGNEKDNGNGGGGEDGGSSPTATPTSIPTPTPTPYPTVAISGLLREYSGNACCNDISSSNPSIAINPQYPAGVTPICAITPASGTTKSSYGCTVVFDSTAQFRHLRRPSTCLHRLRSTSLPTGRIITPVLQAAVQPIIRLRLTSARR